MSGAASKVPLNIFVTVEEKAFLQEEAAKAGLSVVVFTRLLIQARMRERERAEVERRVNAAPLRRPQWKPG